MSARLSLRELTARGRGAIRVLELRGPGALSRAQSLVPDRELVPGVLACLALRDARGELLDEALVLVDSSARLELHLHGAPVLVERVCAELGLDPRESEPPRSIEARAEELLARAASEDAARMLLDQVQGALRVEFERLLGRDEAELRAGALALAQRGRVGLYLVGPPRIVLAGPVNAGKSTLFNALAGRERAVVDAGEGTTRDAVHERIRLGAYAVELFDTAGERALATTTPEAQVERAGQDLAHDLRQGADLVLWLCPPGTEPPAGLAPHERVLGSRSDEASTGRRESLPAVRARADPGGACKVVESLVLSALSLPAEPWIPGAAVPFERDWVETLERAQAGVLRTALHLWLEEGCAH